MNTNRVDQIIQYALLVAGTAESSQNELGPIHLLKYVYLGDLAHAAKNQGRTYTGANWRFYKFGPWAEEVHSRIKPAAKALGAETRSFDWGGDEDGVRYRAADETKLNALELALPLQVASAVKRSVREFDNDTYGLLDFVYRTRPMVRAAPHDALDFSVPAREPSAHYEVKSPTAREEKKRRTKVQAMRDKIREQLLRDIKQRAGAGDVGPAPRYDELFWEGHAWLDSLGGSQIEPEGELEFDEAVWRSDGRRESEIP